MNGNQARWLGVCFVATALASTGCESKTTPAAEPAKEQPAAAPSSSEKSEKTDPAAGAMFGKGRNQAPQVGTSLLERIWVVRLGNNPFGGIQPCVMIVKGIYNAAQHTSFELDFVFNYRSGGNMISRRFTIPVKQMHFMMDHPTQKQFVRLDTVFDVSAAPVDQGTAVTGTVQLMHASNKQVRAAAGDSIPFSLNFSKDPPPAGK